MFISQMCQPHSKFMLIEIVDVLQQGWSADAAWQMLTVKKQAVVSEQKVDPYKLQTGYFTNSEHCFLNGTPYDDGFSNWRPR